MANRIELQTLLENLLESRNVYFQPPESVKMNYPCIRYSRNNGKPLRANNGLYGYTKSYTLIVIDKNPDSKILDKVQQLPYCSFERHYTADNLNHYVFNLYY